MSMRILLFNLATDVDDPVLGFTTRWIKALAQHVDFIYVITMRAGRVKVPDNVRVYSVGKEKGYGEPRRAAEFYRYLFRILHEDRPAVCFSHMIPAFTILAAPVLKFRGIPIITWYAHRQVTVILKMAHHLSNLMVSINKDSYRYQHDKFVSLGHGIDIDLFSPNGIASENPPLLLSVGRLSPIKDLITLLEAVCLLRQRKYDVRCALVGDAPERDRFYAGQVKNKIEYLGLAGIVQLAGAVPQQQVVSWYGRCFAHVNLCPTGALDKAALEAMACGKPSLVANEGFRETLGPWGCRLLFRHGDPGDLSRKIEWLLQQSGVERSLIGEDLRQVVLARHSLERLAEQLVTLFGELCGER
jgi:glycosyltransferase involved in cell wall biosynthesis